MALVGLGEAAKLTGRNRTTIFRAMKSGRLSYTANGAGERQVDVAELQRVFPAATQSNETHVAVLAAQLDAERDKNALLERTNEDLRQRLDASETERRNVQTQHDAIQVKLTALLTDQRESSVAGSQPASPWPRRVLRWLVKQHGF